MKLKRSQLESEELKVEDFEAAAFRLQHLMDTKDVGPEIRDALDSHRRSMLLVADLLEERMSHKNVEVVLNSLLLSEMFFKDQTAQIAGFGFRKTPELSAERLREIGPLVDMLLLRYTAGEQRRQQ